MTDRLLTVAEIARRRHKAPGTVRHWIRIGWLPYAEITPTGYLVRESALRNFVRTHKAKLRCRTPAS